MPMLYMANCLLPQEERIADPKYRRLRSIRKAGVYRSLRSDLIELRAMQLTPGLTRENLDILMLWPRHVQQVDLKPLAALDDEARPFAQANFEGATAEDAKAMLMAILENRPAFGRYMPFYVTNYLRHRRTSSRKLAEEFGVAEHKIKRWRTCEIFHPLTGELRPQDEIHRGKPINTRRNTRVLGI